MQHQVEQVDGRYRCTVCNYSWKREPTSECPGVPVYRWGEWPEHLLTKKQMSDAGFQTGKKLPPPAGVCFREKSPDGKMWLYDRNQGVAKKPISDQARASLKEAAKKSRQGWYCTRCGQPTGWVDSKGYFRAQYFNPPGLCMICQDRESAQAWAAAALTQEPRVLILDTETTALDGEIIQIAIIDTAGEVLLNTYIQPQEQERIKASGAFEIHGISPEMLTGAPTFPQVYEQIRAISEGRQVVIYNVSFDCSRLRSDCARHKLPELNTDEWECVMVMAAQWYGQWSNYWKDYKWQPLNGGHDALGDCQAVLSLLKEMAEVEVARD